MNILEFAIDKEGSASKLADALGVVPSAVTNWKKRGIPHAWQLALELKYKSALRKASLSSTNVNVQFHTAQSENPA